MSSCAPVETWWISANFSLKASYLGKEDIGSWNQASLVSQICWIENNEHHRSQIPPPLPWYFALLSWESFLFSRFSFHFWLFNVLQFVFQNFVTEYFKSEWLVTEEKNATVMQVQLWHDETFMRWRNPWNSIEEYKLPLNKYLTLPFWTARCLQSV